MFFLGGFFFVCKFCSAFFPSPSSSLPFLFPPSFSTLPFSRFFVFLLSILPPPFSPLLSLLSLLPFNPFPPLSLPPIDRRFIRSRLAFLLLAHVLRFQYLLGGGLGSLLF